MGEGLEFASLKKLRANQQGIVTKMSNFGKNNPLQSQIESCFVLYGIKFK